MRRFAAGISLGLMAAVLLTAPPGLVAQDKEKMKEAMAIHQNAVAFVKAFNRGDAKAVAESWWEDGDFMDQDGHYVKGRSAIEKALRAFFAENKGAKMQLANRKTRFVTPDLAIEDGNTDTQPADGGIPTRSRYTIIHVKKGGQWRIASVREAPYVPPTNAEHLRDLDWLVGTWEDEAAKGEAATATFAWTSNGNFLLSTFTISIKGIPVGSGTQWIGWDPNAKHIRSWAFESNGGFGEGVWAQEGNKWAIKNHTTLRDGKRLAMTNVLTRVNEDTITWQSTRRTIDGKALPDTKAIRLKRLKESEK